MKILAIEFSSAQRSVALLECPSSHFSQASDHATRNAQHVTSPSLLARAVEIGGRRAITLIEHVLEDARCEREQIDVVAVGLGPGSYTGIRGSIALAQGWQIGRGTKLLGISSVETLAVQAQAAGMSGVVNVIIDAQRDEFYLAVYQIDPTHAREITPLHLAGLSQIEELAREGQTLIGPDIVQSFASATDIHPDAAMMGRLALSRSDFVPGESLEPIYLRETTFKKAPPPRMIG